MADLTSLRRIAFWTVICLVALACLTYLTDFAILRWRFNSNQNPIQTVVIRQYYAVPRKDGRTEYMDDDPKNETCVNSLYPHAGAKPCWYLTRHRDRRIDI